MTKPPSFAVELKDTSFTKKLSNRSEKACVTVEIVRLVGHSDVFLHTIILSTVGDGLNRTKITFPSSIPRRALLRDLVSFLEEQYYRGLVRVGRPLFGIAKPRAEDYSLTALAASQQATDEFLREIESYNLECEEYCLSLGCYLGSPSTSTEEIVVAVKKHVLRWRETQPRNSSSDLSEFIEDNLQYWNPLCSQWGYTTYKTLTNSSESIAVAPEVISYCQDPEYREFLNVFTRIPAFKSTRIIEKPLGSIPLTEVEDLEPESHLSMMPLHYPQFRDYIKSLTLEQLSPKYLPDFSLRPLKEYPPDSSASGRLEREDLQSIADLIEKSAESENMQSWKEFLRDGFLRYLKRFEQDTYFLEALRAHLETGARSIIQLDAKLTKLHRLFYVPSPGKNVLTRAPIDYIALRLTQLTLDPARTFDVLVESGSIGGDIDAWEVYFASWETVGELPVCIALDLLAE